MKYSDEQRKVKNVSALSDCILSVRFCEGIAKLYDVKSLFKKLPAFEVLRDDKLFSEVYVDVGGYGVVWNGDLDLSCDELWENGKETPI